jgi:2-hydroxycyclohexanecarboxyl-CoA dehydrogenase
MGLSICEHLADRGHKIAVLDLNGDAAEQVAADLRAKGHQALGVAVDVSDRAAVDAAMDKVRGEFGPIEILVTSAGISNFVKFTDITIDQWNTMIAVNLTGTFHCVQSAIPDMIAAKWGRVVLISSSSAQTGAPRMAHYVSSKGGVIGLMRALAREFAPIGITVNTIPPSSIDTPMAREQQELGNLPDHEQWAARIPVGRVGTGDDIAAACAFLCSEETSYITGQIIGVNGGAVP